MNWILISEIFYFVLLALVCLRIIYDTQHTHKTYAYLLLVVFIPIIGIIFYFSLGINYRKNKMYTKKIFENAELDSEINNKIRVYSNQNLAAGDSLIKGNKKLSNLLLKSSLSPLTNNNKVKILVNGEQKFPEVIEALKNAKHHIHIEYYIYEDDEIGKKIEEILIQKSKAGIKVRFIYDDFGSSSVRNKLVKRLREAGVSAFPFYKIKLLALANRLNFRNHRKIIIVDGQQAFIGGINVSDKYINDLKDKNKLYWRDTHLKIEGSAVWFLQYLFIGDYNFCAQKKINLNENYFPQEVESAITQKTYVQIAASGPDSKVPVILYSLLQAIALAEEEILITTPYFIPDDSIMDALVISALSGIKVKLLVPGISDSKLVNLATRSYFSQLLASGAEIYIYNKGFIHSKTMVIDNTIAMIGTANMDIRSFDYNFEVNAIVYDAKTAKELKQIFYEDLKESKQINTEKWLQRPKINQIPEKFARLISPLL